MEAPSPPPVFFLWISLDWAKVKVGSFLGRCLGEQGMRICFMEIFMWDPSTVCSFDSFLLRLESWKLVIGPSSIMGKFWTASAPSLASPIGLSLICESDSTTFRFKMSSFRESFWGSSSLMFFWDGSPLGKFMRRRGFGGVRGGVFSPGFWIDSLVSLMKLLIFDSISMITLFFSRNWRLRLKGVPDFLPSWACPSLKRDALRTPSLWIVRVVLRLESFFSRSESSLSSLQSSFVASQIRSTFSMKSSAKGRRFFFNFSSLANVSSWRLLTSNQGFIFIWGRNEIYFKVLRRLEGSHTHAFRMKSSIKPLRTSA